MAATYEEEVVVARGWHLLGVLSNADACRISRGMVVKAKGDDVQRSVQRLGLPIEPDLDLFRGSAGVGVL